MYKFMQRNKKKMIAVFGVLLMVVFILPTVAFDQNRGTTQEVLAQAGGEPITMGEARQAQENWRSIVSELPFELGAVELVAEEINNDPLLFVLLQREARQMGLRVSDAQYQDMVSRVGQLTAMYGRPTPDFRRIEPAVRDLLLVRALFDRVAGGVKLSEPSVFREMAQNGQRVKLNLAHFAAEDFKKDAPAPTAEQLQKQFDQYKTLPPGNPTEQNSFGFGYLVPHKVQLTYLTVPRDEVARAVRAGTEQIDWEIRAVQYYRQNQSKYPVTQPASTTTQPSTTIAPTTAATAPTTAATAPTSGPTTRPFAEIKEQVIREVMQPDVDARLDQIATALADRMAAEFDAFQRKSPGAPSDFGTRQYLERIAAEVEQRDKVKLGISEINDPKDEAGLRELKGIGQSFAGDRSFAQHVMTWAEPLAPGGQRTAPDVLSIDEPSRPFRDLDGNAYVFQIQDAKPSHPPTDLAAVKEKVEADARTKAAFDAAVAAATKLREQAATAGLGTAAKAAGKDVFTTPDFMSRQGMNSGFEPVPLLPGVTLPEDARQRVVQQTFEMLGKASPEKAHPVTVVELPTAGRVVVAELGDVERLWRDDGADVVKHGLARQLTMQRAQRVLSEYFRPEAVRERTGYKSRNEPEPTQTAASK